VYACVTCDGAAKVNHVIIISIDGGKPSVLAKSSMPTFKRLISEGASTWAATTVVPPLTLPAHTSMLTGVEPAKHKILWNDWEPKAGVVQVPTVFSEATKAGFSTAMFVGKEKFLHLAPPGTVGHFDFDREHQHEVLKPIPGTDEKERSSSVGANIVADDAVQYIRAHKPNLLFIHFADGDDAGHEHGWGSSEQQNAFAEVDVALNTVVKALEAASIIQHSVIIVSADHGGHGHEHGLNIDDDIRIPWVVWGKGVKRGVKIVGPVTTCDTAATVLWLLGIEPPRSFDGKPVLTAFSSSTIASSQRPARPHSD
jgi:predicted AlkP superfamily pyrophosphatase or phosphodiesterase